MCGICGFFNNNKISGQDALERMNMAQGHRGPDDSGTYFKEGAGLGHKRLSVIDLSPNAHQPMLNEDGSLAIVFNGTIFNFPELREKLLEQGHRFKSRSDTEVLLHLYEEKKEGMLKDLKGQFAFAVWDSREKRMLLARDRLGIKPLYFSRKGGGLVFASEIRAILESGAIPKEIDPNGLVSFLECNSVAPPGAIFKGIEVLPAGHYLAFDGEKMEISRYWDMEFSSHRENLLYGEYKERLRKSLFDSVNSMLVGDVPVGVFLSGGIDSSLIAGILRELGREDIETFTIGFPDSSYNEIPHARKVVEKNRNKHHEIEITAQDLIDALPNIIRAMDQPSGDGLNTYLISRETRKRVTVALSGLGGDELFFGYHIFDMIPRALFLTKPLFLLPEVLRNAAFSLSRGVAGIFGLDERMAEVLKGRDSFTSAYGAMRSVFTGDILSNVLAAGQPDQYPFQALLSETYSLCKGLPPKEAASYLEIKTYMQNTLLRDSDSMAMAHALEVRFPILDEEILNLAAEIPPEYKKGKKIFIESVRDLLPPEIQNREKMGFSFPIPIWMKGLLKPCIMNMLSENKIKKAGIFNPRTLGGLLDRFYKGGKADFRLVWSIFLFDLWYQVHIENKELDLG